jgi:hypothetical protein
MSERKAFPLSWPNDVRRATSRKNGKFLGRDKQWISISAAIQRVLYEFQRLNIFSDDIIVSTNVPLRLDGLPRSDQPKPKDPGAAIYWQTKKHGMRCIAIDQYTEVADNIAAIAATLEAMRAIERHGGAAILERAFLGFAALPEKASQPWREVLGIDAAESTTMDVVESRYRALVKVHHPDAGGKDEDFLRITQARDAARMELAS